MTATDPRRVLVFGVGASGVAVAAAALSRGWQVLAVDERAEADTSAMPDGVEVRLGAVDASALGDVDVVVTSPGVPPTQPLLAAAVDRGVPVWSEPELAWQLNEGRTRLVAVSGTNGKTTTTEMIAACLRAPAAGNIGVPLVQVLAADTPPPVVVAELSSFQLHFCHELRPDVAALLNVADDHLDWHGGLDGYRADKARMWQAQRPEDVTVAFTADAGTVATLEAYPPPGQLIRVDDIGSEEVLHGLDLRAGGPHNLANATVAARAALAAGASVEDVRDALQAFEPGPHRLELVADRDGVRWINDSKATNPHAALAALRSFEDIVWIAGGLNKGLDFATLAADLPGRVRTVLTIGACGPELAAVARTVGVAVEEVGQLDAAVRRAAEIAVPGSTVLLAPAAASMDQFRNYAERGDVFRREVEALR